MIKNLIKSLKEKREIFVDIKNQKKVLYGKTRVVGVNGFVLTDDQKAQIDDYFLRNYGQRIDYMSHTTYTAYSGQFDVRYMPETIYIPEFERFMNPFMYYNKTFYDKNVIPLVASNVGVKTPMVLFKCVKGLYTDGDNNVISRGDLIKELSCIGEVFVKETTDTGGGAGCLLADFKNGINVLTGDSCNAIVDKMGGDFVVQNRLKCHQTITSIYSKSVNTFRILTYRWQNRIYSIPAIMRIGQGGSYLDNAHQGGMFVSIDESGCLGNFALTEGGKRFEKHPDTQLVYAKYTIPLFPKCIEAAIKMHTAIPQVGIVNWDFSLDESGTPVLIEGNMRYGGIWLFQMVHGKAAFGDRTDEILDWVKYYKKAGLRERVNSYFGCINF